MLKWIVESNFQGFRENCYTCPSSPIDPLLIPHSFRKFSPSLSSLFIHMSSRFGIFLLLFALDDAVLYLQSMWGNVSLPKGTASELRICFCLCLCSGPWGILSACNAGLISMCKCPIFIWSSESVSICLVNQALTYLA